MPLSPVDANLGLFEVFGFNDVAAYGGIFAIAPAFFCLGAFAEAVGI
jgi:putative oxidoreductase